MIIGIPKEIKVFENRVGMLPEGVRQLVQRGHQVFVEKGAGIGSGFSDQDYRHAGARILSQKKDVYRRAEMIVKVKEPQSSEYGLLKPGLILFAFLHLAAEPNLLRELCRRKVTAIAFETVETINRQLPLLAPMSEIAGSLAGLVGANYLRKDQGGKGILLNSIGFGHPGKVLVIGAGHVGLSALKIVHGLGAHVIVCDVNQERLDSLTNTYVERLETCRDISQFSSFSEIDLLVGAVLIHGGRAPCLVNKKMVRQMAAGSVIVDVAVDQGGCVETIHPTTLKKPAYEQYGVIHYGVTNMPSLAPRTATIALAQQTLPYVMRIAENGIKAWDQDECFKKGLNTYGGHITYPALLS